MKIRVVVVVIYDSYGLETNHGARREASYCAQSYQGTKKELLYHLQCNEKLYLETIWFIMVLNIR